MPAGTRPLVLVAVLVLAGCLGASVPLPGADSSTAATPSGSPVTFPDGPKEPPERPADLTQETVAEYVRTYEYRYAYNQLWFGEHTDISLECEVDGVEEIPAGWRVVVTCTGYSNTGGEATATVSPTVAHADWGTQTYIYRVGENVVTRTYHDG